MGLRWDEHVVDDRRGMGHAQHPWDGEAPDVGVHDGHVPAPTGQGHGQVGGDRRLADPALARRDEQHPRGRVGLSKRHGPPLGVPEGGVGPRGRRRITVQSLPEFLALGITHDGEVDAHGVYPIESHHGVVHRPLDLSLQGAAGHGEGDLHVDPQTVDSNPADHAQVHNAAPQFRVVDRAQGLDDLGLGDRHGYSSRAPDRICHGAADVLHPPGDQP